MTGLTEKDIGVLGHYAQNNNRELYWNYLARIEGNDGYGLLALGVVRNDNAPGATANEFADNRARSDGVRLSEPEWNRFGIDLMRDDLSRRQGQLSKGRPDLALNLPVRDVMDVHDASFTSRHINPDAWTPRELLRAAERHGGEAEAEQVWTRMLDNSRLGVDRGFTTLRDVARYDDAQLDAASYVGRMAQARAQGHYALPNSDPDRIGASNFAHLYDGRTGGWSTQVMSGSHYSLQPVRDPEQVRQLNDTRALRLERQQLREQFHPDDPYRHQPVRTSPQTLAETGPVQPSRRSVLAVASDPSQPGHARHALYRQCQDGVQTLGPQSGPGLDDAQRACVAASLTELAVRNGLDRVDHVLASERRGDLKAGQNLFVVQGNPADPAHRRAHMSSDNAFGTPVERSFERIAALDMQQTQQQVHERAHQPEAEARPQNVSDPVMRI